MSLPVSYRSKDSIILFAGLEEGVGSSLDCSLFCSEDIESLPGEE